MGPLLSFFPQKIKSPWKTWSSGSFFKTLLKRNGCFKHKTFHEAVNKEQRPVRTDVEEGCKWAYFLSRDNPCNFQLTVSRRHILTLVQVQLCVWSCHLSKETLTEHNVITRMFLDCIFNISKSPCQRPRSTHGAILHRGCSWRYHVNAEMSSYVDWV